jgi:hypothetical protein
VQVPNGVSTVSQIQTEAAPAPCTEVELGAFAMSGDTSVLTLACTPCVQACIDAGFPSMCIDNCGITPPLRGPMDDVATGMTPIATKPAGATKPPVKVTAAPTLPWTPGPTVAYALVLCSRPLSCMCGVYLTHTYSFNLFRLAMRAAMAHKPW